MKVEEEKFINSPAQEKIALNNALMKELRAAPPSPFVAQSIDELARLICSYAVLLTDRERNMLDEYNEYRAYDGFDEPLQDDVRRRHGSLCKSIREIYQNHIVEIVAGRRRDEADERGR